MVAFKLPEGKSIDLSAEYLVPLGLGDCTIQNGVLQADLPLDDDEIEAIEAEGFERADTHWYAVEPEPQPQARRDFIKAIGQMPSTTIPPSRETNGRLQLSFTEAVTPDAIKALEGQGFTVTSIDVPRRRGLQSSLVSRI